MPIIQSQHSFTVDISINILQTWRHHRRQWSGTARVQTNISTRDQVIFARFCTDAPLVVVNVRLVVTEATPPRRHCPVVGAVLLVSETAAVPNMAGHWRTYVDL